MFQTLFTETIGRRVVDEGMGAQMLKDIAAHYEVPGRYYHNFKHLDHLAQELIHVKDFIQEWDIIILSTAYHDIIYNTRKQDNEEASAEYAHKALSPYLSASQMQLCSDAILATKSHTFASNSDINHFTDADLAILGSSPERYKEYTAQIRKEYRQYPDLLYKPGRLKVLRHFLAMPQIFKTAAFRERYEAAARQNVDAEIAGLSGRR